MTVKLLSHSDVKHSITMLEAIEAMERAFIQLAQQKVILPFRTSISIPENAGLTLTMPAYLSQEQSLGLKVVSVFPNNIPKNKASINGAILLLEAATGEILSLMDAGYLTALRTGAISGLATKYFSLDKPSNVAIIGSGVQAATQLEAIAAVREIQKIFVWSRNSEHAAAFVQRLESQYDIRACGKLSEAVKTADIICTATSSTSPLIYPQDIRPHVHINAIGSHNHSMREISEEVLQEAVVIVDQTEAAMAEAGEIMSAVDQNKLRKESIVEIGSWLLEKKRDYTDKLTVFKSVGLAIQDLSVAQVVYQNALKKNLGLAFELGI